jgi:hypothetical protein
MTFSFDLCSNFFSNIRPLDFLNEEPFIIKINDTSISLPLVVAAGLSKNVSKLLHEDNTVRKFDIEINFHNKSNEKRIVDVLSSPESTIKVELKNGKI